MGRKTMGGLLKTFFWFGLGSKELPNLLFQVDVAKMSVTVSKNNTQEFHYAHKASNVLKCFV